MGIIIFLSVVIAAFLLYLLAIIHAVRFNYRISQAAKAASEKSLTQKEDFLEEPLM